MDKTEQERQTLLSWTDQAVQDVIGKTEAIVNKPTREWTIVERQHSMALLATTAERALARFSTWLEMGVWINSAGGIVGCLESIGSTARHASFGPGSRCWGRTDLKQDLARLQTLFGNGCSFQTEPIVLEGRTMPRSDKPATQRPAPVANPNALLYSVKDLTALHNLSRQTVIRI
jgi:hypothetical protein